MNIYVENLATATEETQLRKTFETYGEVTGVNMVTDNDAGTDSGTAIVEMTSDAHAEKAIAALNGTELDGNMIKVSVSTAKVTTPA
jgi:RNA recognition motif-containing protein